MHKAQALLISFIFLASGCLNSSITDEDDISNYEWWEVPLEKRHLMDLNFSSWRSTLPEKGVYDWTGPTEYFVEVDLPLEERELPSFPSMPFAPLQIVLVLKISVALSVPSPSSSTPTSKVIPP